MSKEACHDSIRPSSVLSCDPPCNGDHMVCNDTNSCGCEADFVALTDILGQVVGCVEQNSTLSVGAQKKNSEAEMETNYWMYAVVAAGTLFIVFVALALYHMSRSVMKERASMRRMMIKRCGSMDTMTVTNDKLDTRSHFSDPNDLNRKSAVVVTYSIDDDNQKDV